MDVRTAKDGRVKLLEQMLVNAQLTRMGKNTDPVTAAFASKLEAELAVRIKNLKRCSHRNGHTPRVRLLKKRRARKNFGESAG